MPTREQVLERIAGGASFEQIGREFHIAASQAYMIATGVPADSSDSIAPEEKSRPGLQLGGSQALVGVPTHNPNRPEDKPQVMEWVRQRATTELTKETG